MIKVKCPAINSELNVSVEYINSFVSDILSYKIGNLNIFTECNIIDGMTSRTYYSSRPGSSISISGSISSTSLTIECVPNSVFLAEGYKLIFSNVFGASTKIFIGNVNYSNGDFGSLAPSTNTNTIAYLLNMALDSDSNKNGYTSQVYTSMNSVLMSFIDINRFIVFAKFKSLLNPNEYKYYVITSMQSGAFNEVGTLLIADNKIATEQGTRYAAEVIQEPVNRLISSADDVIIQKFIYGNWYCDDLYIITGLSFDVPTLISGRQYYPLGNNLYLLVKD